MESDGGKGQKKKKDHEEKQLSSILDEADLKIR